MVLKWVNVHFHKKFDFTTHLPHTLWTHFTYTPNIMPTCPQPGQHDCWFKLEMERLLVIKKIFSCFNEIECTCIKFKIFQIWYFYDQMYPIQTPIIYDYPFNVAYWLSDRQDKRMDELNLFINYHTKYIVSIIWARHVLTLHLSNANCCKPGSATLYWQLQEDSCMLCNFYQIRSYQTFSSCNPLLM